jgi:(1->4)-alpha-D-glucan 1-alpha-D-glucosylmutase
MTCVTPRATYRIQFNADFTFADALRLVPYLDALGVSHLYASPWLRARSGSSHGYDITDHTQLNPEIGSWTDFEALSDELARRGMGHILDFVPNHMGIGKSDNEWWLDVLEWGQASPYASYFDIDWTPAKAELRGKVLLPVLGAPYGEVLQRGELKLAFDEESGAFSVFYHDHRFPIRPGRYGIILAAGLGDLRKSLASDDPLVAEIERLIAEFSKVRVSGLSARKSRERRIRALALKREFGESAQKNSELARYIDGRVAEFNGIPGVQKSFIALHRLLEAQSYRLAFWRSAADEINYRRFFDVNHLAGLRIESKELFDQVHRLLWDMIGEHKIHGLRIDHIDGLFDPQTYCSRLQEAARGLLGTSDERPLYVVVEKILAQHERLRYSWAVAGTTGYEFLNLVTGLLVNPDGERALDRLYRRFTGQSEDFADVLYSAKKLVIETSLAGELQMLANQLDRISEANWNTRDYTLNALNEALKEVVAAFPVYRTYVGSSGATPEDRRYIDWAVALARKRSSLPNQTIFDFVHDALTLDLSNDRASTFNRREVVKFTMKFQQYTAPVMAKGLEDTSFYRYVRLLALNEVGGDPRRFGLSTAAFNRHNQMQARHWPGAMLTTSTHDTKCGEDARARLAALSELGEEWAVKVRRWAELNRLKRQDSGGVAAPDRNDEYLLYQTLVAVWPETLREVAIGDPALENLVDRLGQYVVKASREAKRQTSWMNPNGDYERAFLRFVQRILDPVGARSFMQDFLYFQERVSRLGMLNSLVQAGLKLTCPGVPDIYQGAELWDLSLVDPDNRRVPDYALRARLLRDIEGAHECPQPARESLVQSWRESWEDGRIKLHVLRSLLGLRRARPVLFQRGGYEPLKVRGPAASRVVAFARRCGNERVIVVAGRHFGPGLPSNATIPPVETWGDTTVALPRSDETEFTDILTGRVVRPSKRAISVSHILGTLPLAVFAGSTPLDPRLSGGPILQSSGGASPMG